jgi:hypothetical protein
MNKLTKPQIAFLKEAAAENGYTCIDRYAPMIKLHELGFVTVSSEGFSTVRAKATKAGRAAHKIARDEYQTNAINSHKHLGVRA